MGASLEDFYPSIKALHVVGVIVWVGGLLHLPRLLLLQTGGPGRSAEARLIKSWITPAMMASWVLGLSIALLSGWYTELWMQAKLILVLLVTLLHVMIVRPNPNSGRGLRMARRALPLLVLLIVFLVILKPF